jgi:hypothetical protein
MSEINAMSDDRLVDPANKQASKPAERHLRAALTAHFRKIIFVYAYICVCVCVCVFRLGRLLFHTSTLGSFR